MSQHIQQRACFKFIRYANCWEDADLLCAALEPMAGKRMLSIASAGDNTFSLLAGGAEVVAADLSEAQLACVEIRRTAFRELEYEELLAFLGVNKCDTRIAAYNHRIAPNLPPWAKAFWDQNRVVVSSGLIHGGKFESYFRKFRTYALPLVHSKKRVTQLLSRKTEQQRNDFFENHWDTLRWRMLFKFFFGRRIMGRLGRDPEFFRYVEGAVSERLLQRTRYALTKLDPSANPFLNYILTGEFKAALPHYLRPENFTKIRDGLNRLTLFHGPIQEAAEKYGASGFDGFNLSDIFEYLDPFYCSKLYAALIDVANSGAKIAYWNMLVPRQCPESLVERVWYDAQKSEALFGLDQAWFYSRFILEEKR